MILPQPLKTLLSYVYICKNFISSYITLPYLTIHYLFLSYLTLTLYLSYPILPYLALSCLTYLTLSYRTIVPYLALSFLTFPCMIILRVSTGMLRSLEGTLAMASLLFCSSSMIPKEICYRCRC